MKQYAFRKTKLSAFYSIYACRMTVKISIVN